LRYRLLGTEPFFVHDLQAIPEFASPADIVCVTTLQEAEMLAKVAGRRQILPEHLGKHELIRQYAALMDGKMVGWVKSIVVGETGGSTWCANMYVLPKHRRCGIGRALMARMLADDRAHDAKAAVLLASHAGAKLYPVVGYQRIGMLYVFTREVSAAAYST